MVDDGVSFDKVALDYDFVSELYNNNDFFINNMPEIKRNILDIGCGSGILSYALSEHFENVYGIDISQPMIDIAKAKRSSDNIKYINMNAETMSFDFKFDFIVSRTTCHHINDKEKVLEKMVSLLSEGGKIIIIDNVSEVPTPKRILNIAGAYIDFMPNIIKYGLKSAYRIYRHSISNDWLNHLDSDVYLSESQSRELYGRILPDCKFEVLGCFIGVIWENH